MIYFALFFFIWIVLAVLKKSTENTFIEKHKSMSKQIKDYENYLKYCHKKNEIPLSKKDFVNELDKNKKQFENFIK